MSESCLNGLLGIPKRDILGKKCSLEMQILGLGRIRIQVRLFSQDPYKGFMRWLKNMLFQPLIIKDLNSGLKKRIFVNMFTIYRTLKPLGITRAKLQEVLQNGSLKKFLISLKTDDLMTTVASSKASSKDVEEVLLWVDNHALLNSWSLQDYPLSNPIGLRQHEGQMVLVIGELFIDPYQVSAKLCQIQPHLDLSRNNKKPLKLFAKQMKLARSYMQKSHRAIKHASFDQKKTLVSHVFSKNLKSSRLNHDIISFHLVENCLPNLKQSFLKSLKKQRPDITKTNYGVLEIKGSQELFDAGHLHHAMNARLISDSSKLKIALNLAKTLMVLHEQGFVLGDISSETIYVLAKRQQHPSAFFTHKEVSFETRLTYISPEVAEKIVSITEYMLDDFKSQACDVWALGVVFYELFHGKKPYWLCRSLAVDLDSKASIVHSISHISFPVIFPENLPINALLAKMLCPFTFRASLKDIVMHLEGMQ